MTTSSQPGRSVDNDVETIVSHHVPAEHRTHSMASPVQLPATAMPADVAQSTLVPSTHQGEILQALLDKIRANAKPPQAAKTEADAPLAPSR